LKLLGWVNEHPLDHHRFPFFGDLVYIAQVDGALIGAQQFSLSSRSRRRARLLAIIGFQRDQPPELAVRVKHLAGKDYMKV
jgi:hypothetical protein